MDPKSCFIFLIILTTTAAKILTKEQYESFKKLKEPTIIPIEALLSKVDKNTLLKAHQHENLDETEASREKRQTDEDEIEAFLCSGKVPAEYFRLVVGDLHCGDVVACTEVGLVAIRCPASLRFHLEKQVCDWEANVQDCNVLTRKKIPNPISPRFKADESICDEGFLACGDGMCLEKKFFCDDNLDCLDGSDETQCDSKNDPNQAEGCDTSQCALPNCFCSPSGKEIPGGLKPAETPQMITISWDDAVNVVNFPIFQRIFNGKRRNPNGCDIKSTFFVSHKYTNYSMVQELYHQGHEIAAHSITHRNNQDYWSEGSIETWSAEMEGSRDIMETFANIPEGEVVGSRAPFLRVGGNRQFGALHEGAFLYDSSLVAPYQNPPLWPYNLFFKMPHPCHGSLQKCPTQSFSVWEMVMNELDSREDPENDLEQNFGCAMLDACHVIKTPSSLYSVLNNNFRRHYDQNRAPFGIYLHAAFFLRYPDLLDTFEFWLDQILKDHSDVYFINMKSVLKWMEFPVNASAAGGFEPWKEMCGRDESHNSCGVARDCLLWNKDEEEVVTAHMATCNQCPRALPWLGDTRGEGRDL